jgi:hypothetical protein
MTTSFNVTRKRDGRKIICRDFVSSFCENFSNEMNKESTQKFIRNFRIPNERELYGLLVKSFINTQLDPNGFIATELQIGRTASDSDADDSVGRIDFMVNYRNTTFLIEVKVNRASAVSNITLDESKTPKVLKPWIQVCDQLANLSTRRIESAALKKIEKLAVMIYLYISPNPLSEFHIGDKNGKHSQIVDGIQNRRTISQKVDYDFWHQFDESIFCSKRRSDSMDEDINNSPNVKKVNFYGYSIFSSVIQP